MLFIKCTVAVVCLIYKKYKQIKIKICGNLVFFNISFAGAICKLSGDY